MVGFDDPAWTSGDGTAVRGSRGAELVPVLLGFDLIFGRRGRLWLRIEFPWRQVGCVWNERPSRSGWALR